MKKLLIVILLAVGAGQAASIIIPKTKTTKDDYSTQVESKKEILPEVIINGTAVARGYSTNFTVELTKFCPKDNPNYKSTVERFDYQNNAEGATVFVKHCSRCNTGVYSEHAGENFKRCTYCGDKEQQESN